MALNGNQKLYVANTTNQFREYAFRIPENPKVITKRIPPRSQDILWTGSVKEIEAIVMEIERGHGAINVAEVPRTKAFIGSCWSLDKQIAIGPLMTALRHNDDVLVKRGYDMRQGAAVAMNEHLHANTPNYRGRVEMEVMEGERPGMEKDIPSERIEAVDEGLEPRGPAPRARSRGRRAA